MTNKAPTRYLIVGQGIAGSALAWHLHQMGQDFLVVDRPISDTASRVAAGLVNPLLGRKIKPDWRQADSLSIAQPYYQATEKTLGGSWWQACDIWRELTDEEQHHHWQQRQQDPECSPFIGPTLPWYGTWQGKGKAAITKSGGVLHAEALVNAQRQWLQQLQRFQEAEIHPSHIHQQADGSIIWQDQAYRAIIWCTGYELPTALNLPYLQSRLSQGCIIDLELPDLQQPPIVLHFGHWLIKHAGIWRLGASYDWAWQHPQQAAPTAISELMHQLTQRYQGDWTILRARAAIRPIIRHSQAVAGAIPERSGHYIIGGLGSRGCTSAPWVSLQLARHLVHGENIPEDLSPHPIWLKYMRRTGQIKC